MSPGLTLWYCTTPWCALSCRKYFSHSFLFYSTLSHPYLLIYHFILTLVQLNNWYLPRILYLLGHILLLTMTSIPLNLTPVTVGLHSPGRWWRQRKANSELLILSGHTPRLNDPMVQYFHFLFLSIDLSMPL